MLQPITTSSQEITHSYALDSYEWTRLSKRCLSLSRIKNLKRVRREKSKTNGPSRETRIPTYSIRSTDKVDLEEFDLKSALFKHMNKIKSANRNTANYINTITYEAFDKQMKMPWIRKFCRP
ncbi:hypothetical protein Tco_0513930 [Tanacetum coccineum]